MNRIVKYIVFITIFILSSESHSQWIKAYNPFNGYVSTLAVIDSNIFAGSKGNLFVSTNNGKNWTSINLTKQTIEITSIAGTSNRIFAATLGDGVFFSSDKGLTWSSVNNGITDLNVSSLGINETTVFAGTAGSGVFYSSNSGESWNNIYQGESNVTINAIMVIDSLIIAGTDKGVILLSGDLGNNWTMQTLKDSTPVSSFTVKNSLIFAGLEGGGVYASNNKGLQWTASNKGLFNSNITSLAANDSLIFAGSRTSGVFHSNDNGANWISKKYGLTDSMVTSLAYSNGNVFAGTQTAGVFLSSDGGVNWSGMNTGLVSFNTTFFLTDKSNVFAATSGGGILITTDQGKSWTALNNGLTNLRVNTLAIYDSTIYASTYDGIFKSTNYGKKWNLLQPSIFNTYSFTTSDSVLYAAASNDGVLSAIVGNENWTYLGLRGNTIYSIAAKDSLVMAGSLIYKGVFYSSDFGHNWKSIGAPYAFTRIATLGWVRENIIVGIDNGIYITKDMGQNWVRKDPYQPYSNGVYSMAIKDSIVLAGTFHGLYLSKDYGENWISIDSGLTGPIYAVAIVGTNLFAGDLEQNIWKTSLDDIVVGINETKNKVILRYYLNQNYPNPFNPVTKISYVLKQPGEVKLIVYDLTGREIKILVNKFQNSGEYSVNFDGSGLSSGVYFYRLKINDLFLTKKMILLQ